MAGITTQGELSPTRKFEICDLQDSTD